MTHTIIFFGGILLALVLGTRLKINIGLAAAAVAFPVGILAGGGCLPGQWYPCFLQLCFLTSW